ncbi:MULTISPECIES: M56 family metallopeptidase [Brevibacterium]|uniref:Peptidase M48 domain-containing protein n=2 Tax=Brevibacterium TaxID=1696 RepID=A0A142NQY7_BRELN|nr:MULTISPECIES: M56 family metallopeptidase [Brevibacterium]AMT94780.1 hypothetical protein A2T55_14345 [Brevibacterium linens]UVI35378.1 M56 family metallopeptidase [Brevibacterium spongiae]
MFVSAIVFIFAAVVVFFASPMLLASGEWQVRRPVSALNAWLGALGLGLILTALGLIFMLVGALEADGGANAVVLWTIGWIAMGGIGAVLALVLKASGEFGDRVRVEVRALRSRWIDWRIDQNYRIITVDDDKPYAIAIPGSPPEICLSAGLHRILDESECAAVIAHEKSHLRRRHALVLRIVTVNLACLPQRLAVSGKFRAAVLPLMEMIADDDAVSVTSPKSVRSALERLGRANCDESLKLRALRLRRLHPEMG